MARRPLSAEEAALWRRVTADVRRIKAIPERQGANPACPEQKVRPPRMSMAVLPGPVSLTQLTQRSSHNSLDANWDKRLSRGEVSPDYVIDLHEHSAAQAHLRLEKGLSAAIVRQARVVLLITGKARGQHEGEGNPRLPPTTRGVIRASVQDWLALSPHYASIAAIRPAHGKHGGAGALYLIMRRSREHLPHG
ncbi:MAG: Smr/MutS family protein [Alphaproteobacteria bacterium]|nr:Smr/MutS family protein [Alphaproteobacteria bacterium]MDE2043268.1 Smr/MutS family protein [Alphaproteobacteria bacterium]MDE2340700.1 Smr/MutS family protein [Alphaproteobacteria bacterium]